MIGLADILGFTVCVLFLATAFGYGPSQADVNRTCVGHGGVLSYSDHTWGVTEGTATVVCGDRVARKVPGR